jgi:hypothetical protein
MDVSEGSDGFETAWGTAGRALELARQYKPVGHELAAMLRRSAGGFAANQSALVLCRGSAGQVGTGRRIVVVALRRQVPLVWNVGQSLPFGVAMERFDLRYDRMESRWTMQSATGPRVQLNPQGAETLPDVRVQGDECPWTVLFAGDFTLP